MANKVEICGVNTAKLPLYKEDEMMEMLEKMGLPLYNKELEEKLMSLPYFSEEKK